MSRIPLPDRRRVGHLTLLREGRTISPREFNALSADERLEIISRAAGRDKFRLLLEAADAGDLVPQLPVQDLYLLIRELGLEDTMELVPLLAPEQWEGCLDLDCWAGDRFDGERVLPWLEALLGTGEDRTAELLAALDRDLLVLALQCHLRVVAGPETIEDEDERLEALRRDGGYRFEFADPERGKLFAALLDVLFRSDPDLFRDLFEGVRWEQGALLEEEALRQRSVRLAEQGFPDPVEARAVYAWLDPDRLRRPDGGKRPLAVERPLPDLIPAGAAGDDPLRRVLAAGLDRETAWELAFLANKVMMAEGIDVGDRDAVRAATARVFRTLNLALEYLAGDDAAGAERLLGEHYLEHLFRAGFSLTLRLGRRARDLLRSPAAPYLEAPFRSLLAGLDRPRPALWEGVDASGGDGERAFADRRDLETAGRWLDKIEVQLRLFEGPLAHLLPSAGGPELADCVPAEPTLADLFLTALANRLLGGEFTLAPLAPARLPELHARVCREGGLLPGLREQTRDWLETLHPGAGAFGDFCLELWADELCPLDPGDLDPRFLAGLIVRAAQA